MFANVVTWTGEGQSVFSSLPCRSMWSWCAQNMHSVHTELLYVASLSGVFTFSPSCGLINIHRFPNLLSHVFPKPADLTLLAQTQTQADVYCTPTSTLMGSISGMVTCLSHQLSFLLKLFWALSKSLAFLGVQRWPACRSSIIKMCCSSWLLAVAAVSTDSLALIWRVRSTDSTTSREASVSNSGLSVSHN